MLIDLKCKEIDFEEYLNFQTCIVCWGLFQKAYKPFVQSHCLFMPVDKLYRAGTIIAVNPCFAK